MKQTRTYALLEISFAAYQEIAKKLKDAGYDHAFMKNGHIDMHGIAVSSAPHPEVESLLEQCREWKLTPEELKKLEDGTY